MAQFNRVMLRAALYPWDRKGPFRVIDWNGFQEPEVSFKGALAYVRKGCIAVDRFGGLLTESGAVLPRAVTFLSYHSGPNGRQGWEAFTSYEEALEDQLELQSSWRGGIEAVPRIPGYEPGEIWNG